MNEIIDYNQKYSLRTKKFAVSRIKSYWKTILTFWHFSCS